MKLINLAWLSVLGVTSAFGAQAADVSFTPAELSAAVIKTQSDSAGVTTLVQVSVVGAQGEFVWNVDHASRTLTSLCDVHQSESRHLLPVGGIERDDFGLYRTGSVVVLRSPAPTTGIVEQSVDLRCPTPQIVAQHTAGGSYIVSLGSAQVIVPACQSTALREVSDGAGFVVRASNGLISAITPSGVAVSPISVSCGDVVSASAPAPARPAATAVVNDQTKIPGEPSATAVMYDPYSFDCVDQSCVATKRLVYQQPLDLQHPNACWMQGDEDCIMFQIPMAQATEELVQHISDSHLPSGPVIEALMDDESLTVGPQCVIGYLYLTDTARAQVQAGEWSLPGEHIYVRRFVSMTATSEVMLPHEPLEARPYFTGRQQWSMVPRPTSDQVMDGQLPDYALRFCGGRFGVGLSFPKTMLPQIEHIMLSPEQETVFPNRVGERNEGINYSRSELARFVTEDIESVLTPMLY